MKTKVLFLCTGNSCRSQMAEGWTRHLLGDRIEPYSAGIEAHGKQKAPSFLTFEVTSEQQEDIGPFLVDVKKLVHDAGLVLVNEQTL